MRYFSPMTYFPPRHACDGGLWFREKQAISLDAAVRKITEPKTNHALRPGTAGPGTTTHQIYLFIYLFIYSFL